MVEVKGTVLDKSDIFMSRNELEKAMVLGPQYRLARVTNAGSDNEKIHIIRGFEGYESVNDLLHGKFADFKEKSYQLTLDEKDLR